MTVSQALLRSGTSRYALIGAAATLLTMGSAVAQDQPAAAPAAPQMEEIVVTGSHIARTNLESTVPVVSISTAQLQATGITNLAQSLNQLPQTGVAGFSNSDTNFSDNGAGVNTLNLRNLGQNRTLILIDGRRTVSGVPIGHGQQAVDLSTIPTYLVDSVDVVTGGAGAAYGSEAVAGVVNIKLKDHYDGVMINEQYGLTTEQGDSETETVDFLVGTSFLDDRAHVLFGLEYKDQGAVYSRDRGFAANDLSVGAAGPVYGPSSYTLNGGFLTDNGRFTPFNDGTALKYNAARDGFNRNQVRTIQIPTQDLALYAKTSYDILDNVTFFADGRYSRDTATTLLEPIAIGGGGATTIGFAGDVLVLPLNNPYIPQSIINQGLTTVDDGGGNFADWRRRFAELGARTSHAERTSYAFVFGFKGEVLDRFKWNAAYSFSEMDNFQTSPSANVLKLQQELNATTINGQIVCSDPAARAAGCVPINLFGKGNASAAAINYIKIARTYTDQNKQDDFNADITGPIYALPYGDLIVSVGYEHRTEAGYDRGDAISGAGFALDTSQPPSGGSYTVDDYWAETKVPVLKDLPGAKSLVLNGSFRYSDYSNQNVGGKQSYSYGLTYAPVEDIQFRAVNSVAIRAPDLTDLYQGRGNSAVSVNDPCAALGIAGAANPALRRANCLTIPGLAARINAPGGLVEDIANQQTELSYVQGNASLTNERAEVFTYGFTMTPSFIPGLTGSVDAFRYKIANAVQAIDIQTAANQCADTLSANFCNSVRRFTSGANIGLITGVDQQPINVGSYDERGIDVALNYSFDVADAAAALTGSAWGDGRVMLGWNYTYLQQLEYTSVNGSTTNQRGLFGAPKHKWNLDIGYSNEDFDFNWKIRYLGSQSYDGGQGGPTFQPFVYNDFSVHYHFNDMFTPYIGVNNVLDERPPLVVQTFQQTGAGLASGVTGTNTVPDVYDAIGRFVYFGIKFQMPWASAPEETAAYTPPAAVAPAKVTTPKSYLVFFDFNKSDLTSQATAIVDQAAANAGPAKVTKLEVTGHTDTVGSDAYNMRLSRRRAESVAAELEKKGIPSSEIEIVAKGKRDLLVPTADGVKEPQNRRVQIVYQDGMTS
jgi:iron complex outermembrane receptor protein